MAQSNPGARQGSSWGTTAPSRSRAPPQASPPAMNDYDSSYSDEDDPPLQMSSWGTQSTAKDGTTEINVTAAGWASLIDPNVKIKAGGVGSGGLHRKGVNYKPVDEHHILNQRLKNQPIPKKAAGGKKQGGKPPSAAPKPKKQFGTYNGNSANHSQRNAAINNHHSISSGTTSTPRRQPLPTGPGWASGELSSTPFWQSSGLSSSKYAPATDNTHSATAPPVPQNVVNNNVAAPPSPLSTGLGASRWAAPGLAASRWAAPQSTSSASSVGEQSESSTQYETMTPPADEPKFRKLAFNIELAPGITAKLTVDGDDYMAQVDQFEAKHHLSIAPESKKAFAEKIQMFVEKLSSHAVE